MTCTKPNSERSGHGVRRKRIMSVTQACHAIGSPTWVSMLLFEYHSDAK